jgi:DHA1 family tetracycline resistance protein-like MFS transporter
MSRAHLVILLVVLMDTLGFGLVLPIVPALVAEVLGRSATDISREYGGLIVSYALMQFVFAPLLGRLSDRIGRRPVILVTLFVGTVDYLICATTGSMFWLVVARAVAGACGANYSTASSFLADITPPERRAQAFGAIGAAAGLGFVIGPLVGGGLAELGTRMPFYAAAVVTLLTFTGAWVFVGESLTSRDKRPLVLRDLNPLAALTHLWQSTSRSVLAAGIFCWHLAGSCVTSIWVLYTAERFHWSGAHIGFSLAAWGALTMAGLGLLPSLVLPRLGERRTVVIGSALSFAAMVLYGVVPQGWLMYPVMILAALGMVVQPALYASLSKLAAPGEQGGLQGAMQGLYALTLVIGPIVGTSVFGYFKGNDHAVYLQGAPFFLAATLVAVTLACVTRRLQGPVAVASSSGQILENHR